MVQSIIRSDTIAVEKEAYFYLKRIGREQRGCAPMTQEAEEKLWRRMPKNKDGLKVLDNDSLGGGDGTYDGKWWSWDVSTLREMLKDGGFEWVECGIQESIAVFI